MPHWNGHTNEEIETLSREIRVFMVSTHPASDHTIVHFWFENEVHSCDMNSEVDEIDERIRELTRVLGYLAPESEDQDLGQPKVGSVFEWVDPFELEYGFDSTKEEVLECIRSERLSTARLADEANTVLRLHESAALSVEDPRIRILLLKLVFDEFMVGWNELPEGRSDPPKILLRRKSSIDQDGSCINDHRYKG